MRNPSTLPLNPNTSISCSIDTTASDAKLEVALSLREMRLQDLQNISTARTEINVYTREVFPDAVRKCLEQHWEEVAQAYVQACADVDAAVDE